MNTPHCDIDILDSAEEITRIVVPTKPIIQTNEFVARHYRLPENRTRLGQIIYADEEHADYHESRATEEDPAIVVEDFASFCTLLCAVDSAGNMAMLHAPLMGTDTNIFVYVIEMLRKYRERVDTLLHGPHTLVISGMDCDGAQLVTDKINIFFPKNENRVTLLSRNGLNTNNFPEKRPGEKYSGMLFVPAPLSQTGRCRLLVIPTRVHKREMGSCL